MSSVSTQPPTTPRSLSQALLASANPSKQGLRREEIDKIVREALDPSTTFDPRKSDLSPEAAKMAQQIIAFETPQGRQIVVVGKPVRGGEYKKVETGLQALNEQRISSVVVAATKQKELKTGRVDPNWNELEFYKKMIKNPIPGLVEVQLIQERSKDPDLLTQFTVVLPRHESDLQNASGDLLHMERGPRRRILVEVLKALADLHKAGVVHRDVKPENILLDKVKNGDPKACFCDPAFAYRLDNEPDFSHLPGTPMYVAPENANAWREPQAAGVKKMYPFSQASDVWALGAILLYFENPEMFNTIFHSDLFGSIPKFDGNNAKEVQSRLSLVLRTFLTYLSDCYQDGRIITKKYGYVDNAFLEPKNKDSILHVIWKMLQVDPKQRITSAEALKLYILAAEKEDPIQFSSLLGQYADPLPSKPTVPAPEKKEDPANDFVIVEIPQ